MANNLVPDSDHISRFCRKRGIGETGRITGVAFYLRENHDFVHGQYRLSVNWLEYLKLRNRDDEVNKIREVYKGKFPSSFFRGEPKIAVINVGKMRKKVLRDTPDSRKIVVEHKPTTKDPSHSRVSGNLKLDDRLIFNFLADCIEQEYPANIP
ncbi:MAG: hypothetical protein NPINA01_18120 [Nitrospinaceae bacterium]|nr:MAG: hypothetical protein NPINA01_18120 [Nitrospinaceae bacterium]